MHTAAHSARKLIGSGWRYPLEHEGLVEDELHIAQELIDVNLSAPSFTVNNPEVARLLRTFECHEDFTADNGHNGEHEVSAAFIMHQFIRSQFGKHNIGGLNGRLWNYGTLLSGFLPNIVRGALGEPAFGTTPMEKLVHSGLFIMRTFFLSQMLMFGYIAVYDFRRRRCVMELLGRIVQYPGVPLSEFLTAKYSKGEKKDKEIAKAKAKAQAKAGAKGKTKGRVADYREGQDGERNGTGGGDQGADDTGQGEADGVDEVGEVDDEATVFDLEGMKGMRLYVDLREGDNAFSWCLSRRVGKAFGHGYQARTQIYIGILFLWSIVAMMVMNLLYWSGAHHNFATVAFILLTVTVVAIVVLTAVSEATKLQDLVCNHRMLIKNEIFSIDQALSDLYGMERDERGTGFVNMPKTPTNTAIVRSTSTRARASMAPFSPLAAGDVASPTKTVGEVEKECISLESAKRILATADDLIGYQEETFNPVTVMGFQATNGVYNSTVGLLVTLLIFALEGYSNSTLEYGPAGWST
mmetsp:Transcript_27206/g.73516  ORF Transcript_27206/g.73516 Transcript_27206/m.73516 type:complete len:524 (+) Transcript_27206:89-1660(+)